MKQTYKIQRFPQYKKKGAEKGVCYMKEKEKVLFGMISSDLI